MKLIGCHMENYGQFSDKDFVFSDGLSAFCEKNGYGKTTLASFIKAMFYGLPSYTSKTKNFDDRQRFYPFGGGRFGGNLIFEKDGKQYRIERFFDKKSNVRDETRVFCGGALTDEFGDNIGKAVFGLDEEAFSRTVFINAEQTENFATGGISAKLNNFVDDTDEENNFESALSALKSAKKRYKAERGSSGLIFEKKEEIALLRNEIANLSEVDGGIPALYEKRANLVNGIAKLEESEKTARAAELLNQQWDTYNRLSEFAEEEKRKFSALAAKYPCGVPGREEIISLNENISKKIAAEAALKTAAFGDEKEQRLKLLGARFSEGEPDEKSLDNMQKVLEKHFALGVELGGLEGDDVSPKERRLEEKFAGRLPSSETLKYYEKLSDDFKLAEARAKAAPTVVGHPSAVKLGKRAKIALWVVFAFAAICLTAGAATVFFERLAGIILFSASGVLLFALGFTYLILRMNALSATQTITVNAEAAEAKAEADIIEKKIRTFLVGYGVYSENGIIYDLASFNSDLDEYRAFGERNAARERLIGEKREERMLLEREAKSYLCRYGVVGEDLSWELNALKSDLKEFHSLKNEKNNLGKNVGAIEREAAECNREIAAIFEKYGVADCGGLSDCARILERDSAEYVRLKESVKISFEKAEKYKRDMHLTVCPEYVVSSDEISKVLDEKRRELAVLDRQISAEEEITEVLPDKMSRLDVVSETLDTYKTRHKLLEAAEKLLERAEQNLKDRYVAPVRERFIHYAQTIESALGEKIVMDKDFKIRFERGGELRDDRHFSAGQRSICALCLRLALIDEMFEGEKPFVIMDDPFVHLDCSHMKKTAETVKRLAGEKQIIYFCCHESRKI